jgi:hypothetical protein
MIGDRFPEFELANQDTDAKYKDPGQRLEDTGPLAQYTVISLYNVT